MPTRPDNERHISLGTFRKNGVMVATPVWFVREHDHLHIFSAPDAGKVKRLRNSPRARVAPCDMRGRLLGEWRDATAFLVDEPPARAIAHRLLREKYGWQMALLDCFSAIGRRLHKRQFIRVELAATNPE